MRTNWSTHSWGRVYHDSPVPSSESTSRSAQPRFRPGECRGGQPIAVNDSDDPSCTRSSVHALTGGAKLAYNCVRASYREPWSKNPLSRRFTASQLSILRKGSPTIIPVAQRSVGVNYNYYRGSDASRGRGRIYCAAHQVLLAAPTVSGPAPHDDRR